MPTAAATRTTGSIRRTPRSSPATSSKGWRASIPPTRRSTKPIASRSSTRLNGKLKEWEAAAAALHGVPLVAYHNSWAYFARRFRLDFVGFVEPKPGVPPSPFHLASLISLMQARKARIIVRQPHEPERDVAFLAKRTGSKVVVLAASVGALPGAHDYLSLFDANVAALIAAAKRMMAALEFLWPPFLVAFCLVGIHAYFGIQVLTRNVVFVDLALAQIAALGATVAFMLGHPALGAATYGYSLAFTLLAAVLLAFTRAWSARIPQEALIGVIYVVAAAAAILLIDRAPQGAEHLKQILTGNILLTGLEIGRRHRAALRRDRRRALAAAARGCRRPARLPGNSCSMRRSASW